jgi:3-hydroxyisobutyrate dehydrogenase
VAATPVELARDCEIIITMVSDAAAIDAAYHGPGGLLSADVTGKLFIEMSTVRPETQQALAAKVREKGAVLIECPVGGTVAPARDGKLFGFVGGAEADVARARPVLEQMCRRVEHVGPIGAGARVKLATNLPLLVYWQALSEALSLCQPLAIDPARLLEIFADTSGGPNFLKGRGPVIAAAIQGKDTGLVTFDVDLMRKDLRTMIEEAASIGFRLPLTARALECCDEAAREGIGALDTVMLPANWLGAQRARVKK